MWRSCCNKLLAIRDIQKDCATRCILGSRPQIYCVCSYLIEETGYESRQTSKLQTKTPRWRLEGPRPCFSYTLCMNYVIAMFLLVIFSYINTRNFLLCFARFCARSTPKIANKNLQQRALPGYITISLY